ncbi:VWA domain-containing protein [Candidatus Daviesbacteria bacterium]|nr:VWA domain-containing protein [Candidatus Daviesbacteria bacterium]
MAVEIASFAQSSNSEDPRNKTERNRFERNRLIAHIGRVFARRYDIAVIPSRQKGVWATALNPKVTREIIKYIEGERPTLDDLPAQSFQPEQILYDEQSAQEMSWDEINTILHHEAGHAKYTDFRSLYEGQRAAKDEGYLPTSFWLTFEGIEDPRVNILEGEESPSIDNMIRSNQANDLQKRITEFPLKDRPYMLQFVYECFHRWLYGKGIPELVQTEVGSLGELAAPLLNQYFQNTDLSERKKLQQKIWDIAKVLEREDLEDEKKRQMAKQQGMKGQKSQNGSGQGQGKGQSGQGQQGEGGMGSGQGEGAGAPHIPGGKNQESGGAGAQQPSSSEQSSPGGQSQQEPGRKSDKSGKDLMNRIKSFFGKPKGEEKNTQAQENQSTGHDISKPSSSQPKSERIDLSEFSDEQLKELQEAIDQVSPAEKAALEKRARQAIDELQKEALEQTANKTLKLEKNKKTGEYEAKPQLVSENEQKNAASNYQQILNDVKAQEKAEAEAEEQTRKQQEEMLRQMEAQRREKLEMEKAGFDPETEREKYQIYKNLEDSMYTYIRNFRQAIEKVIPRKKEGRYEGGFFSGPRFDKKEIVRKAPMGDERFHLRQVEKPTGAPRLFVGLVVDNSGSMGIKMAQARKTMIFFAEVCKDMGIPFMAVAFGNDAKVIKSFRQAFDSPAEKIKPALIDYTDASGGSTNMHAGIEEVIKGMNEGRRNYADSHGIIFVVTDGGANVGLTEEALRDYVEENRGRLTFKAFGLSGNAVERQQIQGYLNLYFGESNCAYPQKFEDLPDEAFRLLRTNLIQFRRFIQ